MRIVIVDDDSFFTKIVGKEVKDFFAEKKESVKIKCCDGHTLLKELQVWKHYDIYLLDVQMPEMDGLELAEKIHDLDANARIVFLTSFDKYACQSYQVKAYYYILKDSYQKELLRILEQVCIEEEENRKEYYIILTETKYYRIKINDILYLTKEKKYVIFHCLNGMEYKERKGIESIYSNLPHERFLVVNRGIVVNMKYIVKYAKREITIQDGKVFPVSRREGAVVKDRLADYWGGLL